MTTKLFVAIINVESWWNKGRKKKENYGVTKKKFAMLILLV